MLMFPSSVVIAGLIIGLLLMIALLKQANKTYSDYLLIYLLFFLVADIFIRYIWIGDEKFVSAVPFFINLLFAPVLFMFLKNQYEGQVFSPHSWLHFLAFGGFQGTAIFAFLLSPYWHLNNEYKRIVEFDLVGDIVSLSIYSALCMRVIFIHWVAKKFIARQRVVHVTLIIILFIYLLIACVVDFQTIPFRQHLLSILYGLLASSLLVVSFVFLCEAVPIYKRHEHISTTHKKNGKPGQKSTEKFGEENDERCGEKTYQKYEDKCVEKYGSNRLPDFIKHSILKDLHQYMLEKRPWIDFDLRLAHLADCINVNPHHLSQIINADLGKSFACYVNEFRVKHACELLALNVEKSVTDIALESGFSSKSSFNTLFKKQTGLTPTDYRKKCDAINVNTKCSKLRASSNA